MGIENEIGSTPAPPKEKQSLLIIYQSRCVSEIVESEPRGPLLKKWNNNLKHHPSPWKHYYYIIILLSLIPLLINNPIILQIICDRNKNITIIFHATNLTVVCAMSIKLINKIEKCICIKGNYKF